jgi:hypothetical protein
MGWMAAGSEFESCGGKIFLVSTSSIPAMGLTESPVQCTENPPPPRVKRRWRDDDHSPPASVKVKDTCTWMYI